MIVIFIVENKSDLESNVPINEGINESELKKLSEEISAINAKISAKNIEDVEKLFMSIGEKFLEKIENKNEEEEKEEKEEKDEEELKEKKKYKCCFCIN